MSAYTEFMKSIKTKYDIVQAFNTLISGNARWINRFHLGEVRTAGHSRTTITGESR